MNTLKLSIIIATLNCKEQLKKTLQSIFSQHGADYEIVVVDGASTDGTLDILKSSKHKLKYISEPDSGIYNAMNKGMTVASGEYLQFLNAGDIYFDEDSLSKVSQHLNGKNDIVFGDIHLTNHKYEKIFHVRYKNFDIETLKKSGTGTCNHQAFFVKKSTAPHYNEQYKLKSELNWYIDIASKNNMKCHHIGSPLIKYTIGGCGYINFWTNLYEWICVVQRRFGTLQNIRNTGAYWRFIKYRYPTLKKIFK